MNPFEIPDFNQLYQQAQNNQGRRLLQHFASMREQLAQKQPIDQPLPVVTDRPINQNLDLIQNQSLSDLVQPVHSEVKQMIAQHLDEQWIQLTQPLEDLLQQSDTELDEICDSLTLLNQPFPDPQEAKQGLAQIFFSSINIDLDQPLEVQIMSIIQSPEDYPKNAAKVNLLSKIFNVIEIIYNQPILMMKTIKDMISSLKSDGFQYRRDFQIDENFFLRFSEYFYYYKVFNQIQNQIQPLFSSLIREAPFNQIPKSMNKRNQLIKQFKEEYIKQVADLLNQIDIEPINLITEVPYTQLKQNAKVTLIDQIQLPILPQLTSFLYSEPIDLTCLQHVCFLESRQVVDHIIYLLQDRDIQSKDDINLEFIFHTMTYMQRDQDTYYIGSQQNTHIQQYIQGIYSNFIQVEISKHQLNNLLDISLSQSFNDPTQHSQQIIQCNIIQVQSLDYQMYTYQPHHNRYCLNSPNMILQNHLLNFQPNAQYFKIDYTQIPTLSPLKLVNQQQNHTLPQQYNYLINSGKHEQIRHQKKTQQQMQNSFTNYDYNQSYPFFAKFYQFRQRKRKSTTYFDANSPDLPNYKLHQSPLSHFYNYEVDTQYFCNFDIGIPDLPYNKQYQPSLSQYHTYNNNTQHFCYQQNNDLAKYLSILSRITISTLSFLYNLIIIKIIQLQRAQSILKEMISLQQTSSKTPNLSFDYHNQAQISNFQFPFQNDKQNLGTKYQLSRTRMVIVVLQLLSLAQQIIIKSLNNHQCIYKIT